MNRGMNIYHKYKDRFTQFRHDHKDIYDKHPECAGDWDAWLIKYGIDLVLEKQHLEAAQ